jgi:eukaryotic-like serine/threonine-protein kinase
MAPEQARSSAAMDHRCDLWALGVILYRLLAGRLPFAGDDLFATLSAIAVDTPTPVRELNPDVPPALADLIERLMSKDPAGRPASAGDVARELRAIERDLAGKKAITVGATSGERRGGGRSPPRS